MTHIDLFDLLDRFARTHVLVLGDVMLDRFVYGSVSRISPEAPIPVMNVERSADMPGGAGNVVRNCAALGAKAQLIGLVGDDATARELQAQLRAVPGVDPQLIVDAGRPTTLKTRFVAERQQIMRADSEASTPAPEGRARALLARFERALPGADVVILSDYAKGVLSDEVTAGAIAAARAAGKVVVVDPKSKHFARYRGASILTPNRHELQAAVGHDCATDAQIEAAARSLLAEGICDTLLVTRGPDGMSVVASDGTCVHLPTTAREVYDVSGAGDTVLASLCLALASGADVVTGARLANLAAGVVVGKRGTATITTGELIAAIGQFEGRTDHSKIFGLQSALQVTRSWRDRGLKVAFTNGCFDLLHPGHISLLEQARRTADRLVVGLNADSSVRRLKGSGRPAQTELSRAIVLSSLKSVDAVVIFEQDTPLSLIEALEPDVLVKGSDYTLETVVGADVVRRYGGRVVLADLVQGHSTTNTLKRVSASPVR